MSAATRIGRNSVKFKGTGQIGAFLNVANSAKGTYLLRARPLAAKAATSSSARAALTTVAAGGGVNTAFTGSNGAAWPAPWVLETASVGSAATIQSNQGSLAISAIGSYNDLISMEYTPAANNYDIAVDMVVKQTTGEQYQVFLWRATGYYDSSCYEAALWISAGGAASINVWDQPAGTVLGSASVTIAVNDVLHWRVSQSGTTMNVKWWWNATTEPGTWNFTTTNASHASGKIRLAGQGGFAGTVHTHVYDNYVSNVAAV